MGFEYLPKLWPTRLAVMRDVFPWVTERIKEVGGLAADDNLASHASQVAFLQAHDEYRLGGRSTRPEVVAIHHRHNSEWETLTGIGPLGTPDDWRAAGHAAGAPADAIQGCDVDKLARFIAPWAIARRVATETTGTTQGDTKDDTPKKSQRKLGMNAKAADCARRYRADKGKTPLRTIVSDYVDEFGGSADYICRILSDNPGQWKGDTKAT